MTTATLNAWGQIVLDVNGKREILAADVAEALALDLTSIVEELANEAAILAGAA